MCVHPSPPLFLLAICRCEGVVTRCLSCTCFVCCAASILLSICPRCLSCCISSFPFQRPCKQQQKEAEEAQTGKKREENGERSTRSFFALPLVFLLFVLTCVLCVACTCNGRERPRLFSPSRPESILWPVRALLCSFCLAAFLLTFSARVFLFLFFLSLACACALPVDVFCAAFFSVHLCSTAGCCVCASPHPLLVLSLCVCVCVWRFSPHLLSVRFFFSLWLSPTATGADDGACHRPRYLPRLPPFSFLSDFNKKAPHTGFAFFRTFLFVFPYFA